jgi:NADPH:quinone reductase-like Zn-dependent oxidoreductase
MTKMKAVVNTKYGPPEVLQLKNIEKPVPKENEVLVKVQAASLNAADWHLMRAEPFLARFAFGLFKPKHTILGADISGTVEAVGNKVTLCKIGDEVFGDISACGWGGFAEYTCADEKALGLKPTNLSFQQAASVPLAANTALQALRTIGRIQANQKVLINGASGGVGTFAIQIAKIFDAEVTAICSTRNIELVRSLGADHVIDYLKEDFTKNGKEYDLILAANGYHHIRDYQHSLSAQGIYVMTGGNNKQLFQAMLMGPFLSKKSGKTLTNHMASPNREDLLFLKDMLEAGEVVPVIDRTYSLAEVPEAMRYLEEGHARGKIVIEVG